MNTKEKLLLLDILMTDIRGDWDGGKYKRYKDIRVWKCLELIGELNSIAIDYTHKDYLIVCNINWDNFYKTMGEYLTARFEGRALRKSVCDGGYEGLDAFHKLKLRSRSKEFTITMAKFCRGEF